MLIILNVAAGKFKPLPIMSNKEMLASPKFLVNVDTSYFSDTKPASVETECESWTRNILHERRSQEFFLNEDAFEFMERTRLKFDRVSIYRFLEHVSFTQVEYFIYLVSTVTRKGALVDVIVPDYMILAEMIMNEENYMQNPMPGFNFASHNILLTTELLNEPSCPHASIWTKNRMKYFWELEGRFKVAAQHIGYKFDGRDIYLRAIIERL